MLKLKGMDFWGVEDEILIDTSKEFYINAREDKSDSDLEENDAILVDTNDGTWLWKKGSLTVDIVPDE